MIFGHDYWLWIWYGILVLGLLGFFPAVHWGRQTHWKNKDELLRATGTILVSVGMILLLWQIWNLFAYLLLGFALACFVGAFIIGRRLEEESHHRPTE
jgi:mannose/fructose/N-acetylgalactosamine-specific phosphotransferase system component IIC